MVCRLPSPPTVARGDDVLAEITGGQGLDPSVDLNADDGNDSLRTLVFAIAELDGENTQDLVLYIVGEGGSQSLKINDKESLTPTQLDSWLDAINDVVTGNTTVILDSNNSGSFIPALSANKRIIVTGSSANQDAPFFSDGDISF